MDNHALLSTLRKLGKTLETEVDCINYGGCGVVAGLVGAKLEALGLQVDVVTQSVGWGLKPSLVRSNVKDKSDPADWDRNGLSRAHLAVRFRSYNGRLYSWDSEGLYYGGTNFGIDGYQTTAKMGEGLTVEETKAMSSVTHGWNPTFDRGNIPAIERIVNVFFP